MTNLSDLFPAATGGTTISYTPAMLRYTDSTSYQSGSMTFTGSSLTFVCRFKADSFTGGGARALFSAGGGSGYLLHIVAYSSDHATNELRNQMQIRVEQSDGTDLAQVLTSSGPIDGMLHSMVFAYNSTTGTVTWFIDGSDVDDAGYSGRVETTGTMNSSAATVRVGSEWFGDSIEWVGDIGFLGLGAGDLAYSDFFDSNDSPIQQDEAVWASSGWGSQPFLWNENGDLRDNRGSASDFSMTGTITVADFPS